MLCRMWTGKGCGNVVGKNVVMVWEKLLVRMWTGCGKYVDRVREGCTKECGLRASKMLASMWGGYGYGIDI